MRWNSIKCRLCDSHDFDMKLDLSVIHPHVKLLAKCQKCGYETLVFEKEETGRLT